MRQAAAQLLAAVFALTAAPVDAALVNPNTRLPRSAEVALRRAIPALNKETRTVQAKLEDVLFLLRIPQRKPWDKMQASVKECGSILASQSDAILAAVPETKREAAASLVTSLGLKLDSLLIALEATDADVTASRVAAALNDVASLELAQTPGLPFLLPAQYASRPRLVGRAVAELTLERRGGESFEAMEDGRGRQSTGKLRVVLDGYNAPLTAGNWAVLVKRGFYSGGIPLLALPTDEAVIAVPSAPSPLAAKTVPLEIRPQDEFEPRYRVPLNPQDGDALPVLPLSVYGAVAMSRGPEGNDSDGTQFFLYRYARRTAGLGGLAFEEGSYSVCWLNCGWHIVRLHDTLSFPFLLQVFGYVVDGLVRCARAPAGQLPLCVLTTGIPLSCRTCCGSCGVATSSRGPESSTASTT